MLVIEPRDLIVTKHTYASFVICRADASTTMLATMGFNMAFGDRVRRNYNCHLENPEMEITTREYGNIPGCVPAVDVHVGVPDDVRDKFVNDYLQFIRDYRSGKVGKVEWLTSPIHVRTAPSSFRNPAPKSKGNYYAT